MSKIFYPALFHQEDDGGYSVRVPDIQGCNTQGDNLQEATEMAFDAIGICIADMLEDGKVIPKASALSEICANADEFIVMVEFDFDKYCRKYDNRAIKKTLTIPAWLNTIAEKAGMNFSQLLQDAIKKQLNLF